MDKLWKSITGTGQLILILSLIFTIASCGGSDTETEEKDTEETTETIQEPTVDFGKIIDEMPDPTTLPVLLERSDIPFNESLSNPADLAQNYMTTDAKAALNLGVYSTDLGYLSAYSQVDDAITYFKSTQSLVDHLKIAGAFEMSMMARFENNLSNQDSLITLVNQSTELTKTFLNENERYNVSAMIVTGTFVEGLYIATQSVQNYPDESFKDQLMVDMVRTIAEQEEPLADLITLMENTDDERAKELLVSLKGLKGEFETLDLANKLAGNQGDFVLKASSIAGITEKVSEIRGGLVN